MVVGLGGSATNDAGIGMLSALGWQFLDASGVSVSPVGALLNRIERVVPGDALASLRVIVACDVTNPRFGPQGAARVYAAQKGASPEEIGKLDRGLEHFASVCRRELGIDQAAAPGAGAAGGLGFALLAFLHAEFRKGAELAIELCGLERHLRGADLCLTG